MSADTLKNGKCYSCIKNTTEFLRNFGTIFSALVVLSVLPMTIEAIRSADITIAGVGIGVLTLVVGFDLIPLVYFQQYMDSL